MEATKFTEVGYVGRDVESMIRDLLEAAIRQVNENKMEDVQQQAEQLAEERLLDILAPLPLPSTIGKISRCTPSRETSGPLLDPFPAILSISSRKIMP